MADSTIAIDEPAVTDKLLDTTSLTVGLNTVERERIVMSGAGATDFILPVAHDAASAGNPMPIGGYAKAAAPADVADADRVNAWFLLNGAQATVITAAGALVGGDAANGLDVDVTRVGGTVAVTQSGTWDEVGINDSGNSITVDNAALSVVGGGVEATALRVTVASDSTGVLSVDDNGGAITVDNAGTFAVQVDGSALTSLQLIDDVVFAEDAAHTTGDKGIMSLAVRASSPTERSAGPTDGDYEPLGVNEVGALWGTLTPSANGGCTTFMASGSDGSSILVATAQVIKATAGVMYGYFAYNPEAAVTFVHFYNTAAASVTVGTTNPLFTIQIPPASAANLSLPYGITFSNAGWSCAATTTAGGNTAPATGVSLTVWYK